MTEAEVEYIQQQVDETRKQLETLKQLTPRELYGEWRTIPSHPTYEASTHGYIRSKKTYKLCGTQTENRGYVHLDGKMYETSRIIFETFCDDIPNKEVIHHKDADPSNDRLDNLVCLTNKEHRVLHGCVLRLKRSVKRKKDYIRTFDVSLDEIAEVTKLKLLAKVDTEAGFLLSAYNSVIKGDYFHGKNT